MMQIVVADSKAQWKPVRITGFMRVRTHMLTPVPEHGDYVKSDQGEKNEPCRGINQYKPQNTDSYRANEVIVPYRNFPGRGFLILRFLITHHQVERIQKRYTLTKHIEITVLHIQVAKYRR